jgi:hypothetical protein
LPNPVPPPSIPEIDVARFRRPLDDFTRRKFAGLMGCKALPEDVVTELEHLIAVYRAQVDENVGANSTTVGASIGAIDEQLHANEACIEKLGQFTNDRSAIDADTFEALSPRALAIQQAIEEFSRVADKRKEELQAHERVIPATEALKYFCAMLSGFFKEYAPIGWRLGGLARRRNFAMAVLSEAGVERTDFITHPKRLDEFLNFFIPVQDLPPHWVRPGKRRRRPT